MCTFQLLLTNLNKAMQALLLSYQSSDTSLVGLLILVICITNILDIDVEMPNAKCRMPMPDAECRGLQMAQRNNKKLFPVKTT